MVPCHEAGMICTLDLAQLDGARSAIQLELGAFSGSQLIHF